MPKDQQSDLLHQGVRPTGRFHPHIPRKINRTSGNLYPFVLTFCFIYVILKICYVYRRKKTNNRCSQKCYTLHQIIFFHNGDSQKNASEPLQLLGYIPITVVHQMLHWCNIFKENSHSTISEKLTTKSRRNYNLDKIKKGSCKSRFRQPITDN